jgi:hypothetical protein
MTSITPAMARKIERVHRCGPRAVGELFTEIIDKIAVANPNLAADARARLDRYAALDQHTVAQVGGDRFPANPLRLVKP